MKKAGILIVAISALVCTSLSMLTSASPESTASACGVFALVLVPIAAIMGIVHAGHLQHPRLRGTLIVLAVIGLVSCAWGINDWLGYIDVAGGPPPAVLQSIELRVFGPLLVLPLATILSALLLRRQQPSAILSLAGPAPSPALVPAPSPPASASEP